MLRGSASVLLQLRIHVAEENGTRGQALVFNNAGILVKQKFCSDLGLATLNLDGLSSGQYVLVIEIDMRRHLTKTFEIIK